MLDHLLDLFFPRIPLSGAKDLWVSEVESAIIRGSPIVEEEDQLRQRGIQNLHRLTAATYYAFEPAIKQAIHLLKYQRIPSILSILGDVLSHSRDGVVIRLDSVLCPVPLHWTRRFQRGFNQAELLARYIGKERGIPVRSLLRRTRPTGHQAWRTRAERLMAVTDAFTARDVLMPDHVILIDDLSTTGATLDACAAVLRRAGVRRVDGWVVAKG